MAASRRLSRLGLVVAAGVSLASACGNDDGAGPGLGAAGAVAGEAGAPNEPASGGSSAGGQAGTSAGHGGDPTWGGQLPIAGGGGMTELDGSGSGSPAGAASDGGGAAGASQTGECLVDGECEGNEKCQGTSTANVCVHRRDACLALGDCEAGEYCDGYCRPLPGLGEPCLDGRCAVAGPYGLRCIEGKCQNADLDCSYEDDACGAGRKCVNLDHHSCDPAELGCECREWGVADGLCPQDTLGSGTPPLDNCYDPERYCNAFYSVNAVGYCQKRALEGESCHAIVGPGVPVETVPCAEGLYCDEEFKCRRAPEAGEPCLEISVVPESDGRCWREDKVTNYTVAMVCSTCARGSECVAGECKKVAANYGESCDELPCGKGLHCVKAQVAGQCVSPL